MEIYYICYTEDFGFSGDDKSPNVVRLHISDNDEYSEVSIDGIHDTQLLYLSTKEWVDSFEEPEGMIFLTESEAVLECI
jgi:hypothetical protein